MATEGKLLDHFVQLGERRVHYLEWTNPGAPVLLLVAGVGGLGGVARQWVPFAEAMCDRYRVLAPEMRGHGFTDRAAADDYTWERVMADIDAFLDAVAPGDVDLVGHSAGGSWGYVYAATRPERVRRLVIGDMGLPPEAWLGEAVAARALAQRWASPGEAAEWVRTAYGVHESLADWLPKLMADATEEVAGAWRWRQDPAIWPTILRFLAPSREGAPGVLQGIRAPSLLVRGADSAFLPREGAEALAAAIPGCQLVEVPAAGHVVQLANPEGFLTVVRSFLADGGY